MLCSCLVNPAVQMSASAHSLWQFTSQDGEVENRSGKLRSHVQVAFRVFFSVSRLHFAQTYGTSRVPGYVNEYDCTPR